MRLATILEAGRPVVALVRGDRVLCLEGGLADLATIRAITAGGAPALAAIAAWAAVQPAAAWLPLGEVRLGPAVPDPGAVYTIGLNYGAPGAADGERPERPLVYGKLPTAVTGHGSVVTWDRSLTPNVDPEVELGMVIGEPASSVEPGDALRHVFGYTCINDISSRDPWLDGDQWLLGKSMAGFCPVGPWIVTADEVAPDDLRRGLRLGCTINGVAVQEGSTAGLRFSIEEIISYLSRHTVLRPGDLIATGTPARLAGPMGPGRHLRAGDVVTVRIERIGELTTTIA